MYPILALIFFSTLLATLALITTWLYTLAKSKPHNTHPSKTLKRLTKFYFAWLVLYVGFIAFATGPTNERLRLAQTKSINSPYKLPWAGGVSRFVSQGNRSFTSHRGEHLYAWDFCMAIGTEVQAARAGKVLRIEQSFHGIGLHSNYIVIEHDDGTRALYAHIESSALHVGDDVQQGQVIALSGMVGQTINPHVHFVVFNHDENASLPISFSDVSGGVPLAGHFYTSGNH